MIKRTITALMLSLGIPASGNTDSPAVPDDTPLTQNQLNEIELLSVAENFNGRQSLDEITALLQSGLNINAQDTEGNTPLLLLCRALELDYRYNRDQHYAQAVDAAIILLLQHGADFMHENRKGCNAVFFFQSKPELLDKLTQQKLISKELAVRIPSEPLALARYVELRINQVQCSKHKACKDYLVRRYCAPAYDRVQKKLVGYLSEESAKRIPKNGIRDSLIFIHLADEERAAAYVESLIYWEHGEHFIEDIPMEVLRTLHETYWDIDTKLLYSALDRLNSLMPREGEDMISCNSAQPIKLVLEMLERQEGINIVPLLQQYTTSRDPDVAYQAYRLMLRQNNLPEPTPLQFEQYYNITPDNTIILTEQQRRIYECARVDEAMRNADIHKVSLKEIQQAMLYMKEMGVTKHAAILARIIKNGNISTDTYLLKEAYIRYKELVSPAPRAAMARYIFDHAEQFSVVHP